MEIRIEGFENEEPKKLKPVISLKDLAYAAIALFCVYNSVTARMESKEYRDKAEQDYIRTVHKINDEHNLRYESIELRMKAERDSLAVYKNQQKELWIELKRKTRLNKHNIKKLETRVVGNEQ